MRKVFALLVGVLLSTNAFASAETLRAFFHSVEGDWSGTGIASQVQSSGRIETNYSADVTFENTDDGVWNATAQTETEDGTTQTSPSSYTVQDDNLLVNGEPVQVTETTPATLTYHVKRVDVYTGRLYELTFSLKLASSGLLSGHNLIQLNGVTISDDSFELSK